ncbi:hypothetical protein CEXT_353071 [Caerostris extrusa]|uniref:Uncharacterized protein n=1 Tax=Caerostris extrusa TaxID=172846 RepID=A0AAV4Q493_CAEEX|nr:hypothetical protein CEXT_353071 [Caerostris extrusa]
MIIIQMLIMCTAGRNTKFRKRQTPPNRCEVSCADNMFKSPKAFKYPYISSSRNPKRAPMSRISFVIGEIFKWRVECWLLWTRLAYVFQQKFKAWRYFWKASSSIY